MKENAICQMEDFTVNGIPCVYVTDDKDDAQWILFNVTTSDVEDLEKFKREYPEQVIAGNDYARGIFLRGTES